MWDWPTEDSKTTYSQEFHWRQAAKWNNLTWKQFLKMEGEEQSQAVATYETSLQLDAVRITEANKKANRKNKRGHSGS